jgi:23S rRNA (cytosine1962-C5)-methyltransferase
MHKVILKRNEEHRIKKGHLWIFSNEIENRAMTDNGIIPNGDLVEVYDSRNNFLAAGFYNANSLISVRILAYEKVIDLAVLFERKLEDAYVLRKTFYPDRNSFRFLFSESDFLPGLIIDKYNDTYVLQIYSYGMQRNINLIVKILLEKYGAKNIFSKNEDHFRMLEGLPVADEVYVGKKISELIDDGFLKYKIDFESSHKTGFYFDQCDNRVFAGKFCKEKTILDCFCNSGGFGLHSLLNGASAVTFVDSSTNELERVKTNIGLNNIKSNTELVQSDVFDFLEKCINENKKFDVVILDPPAFAKNKKSVTKAVKAYEKLNRLGLQVLNVNGLLFTSSCSFHLKKEMFLEAISSAAQRSQRQIQQFYFNNASLDHPSLPSMEETTYLKFAAFRVM